MKDEEKILTLADALPNEIERVTALLDDFKNLRGQPNIIVEPQIMIMTHSINAAVRACASGDCVEMLKCYEDLKGYEH